MPKRILSLLIGLALVLWFAVACSSTPTIIEHPEPTLTVDADTFPAYYRILGCGISDLYGGLEPNYPTAYCYIDWVSGNECIRESGGFIHICEQVAVYLDGDVRLVGTQEELGDLFAPIESADEALSYALLATGLEAKFDHCAGQPGWCDHPSFKDKALRRGLGQ